MQSIPQRFLVGVESQLVLSVLIEPFYLVAPVSQFDQQLKFRVLAEIGEVPFAVAFFSRKRTLVDQPA